MYISMYVEIKIKIENKISITVRAINYKYKRCVFATRHFEILINSLAYSGGTLTKRESRITLKGDDYISQHIYIHIAKPRHRQNISALF